MCNMKLFFCLNEFQKMFYERRKECGVNKILVNVEQMDVNFFDYSLKFKKGVFMI